LVWATLWRRWRGTLSAGLVTVPSLVMKHSGGWEWLGETLLLLKTALAAGVIT